MILFDACIRGFDDRNSIRMVTGKFDQILFNFGFTCRFL